MPNKPLSYSFPVVARISTYSSSPDYDGRAYSTNDALYAYWLQEYASRLQSPLTAHGTTKAARDAAIDAEHARILAEMEETDWDVTDRLRQDRSRQSQNGWAYSAFLAAGHYVVNGDAGQVCWFGISEVETPDAAWYTLFNRTAPIGSDLAAKVLATAKAKQGKKATQAKQAKQAKK